MREKPFYASGEPVIIRRHDVESLLTQPKPVRDQLILSLPSKMGMRTSEIRFLHRDQVDLDEGCIYVSDSKKHRKYPVPVPWDVSQLLAECLDPHLPYVVRRNLKKSSRYTTGPVCRGYVYYITRKWAVRAGLPNWDQVNTTLLRHYFAATWIYQLRGSVETLRRIMRHKSLHYTQQYLARLVFFEDIQEEVDRLHRIPNLKGNKKMLDPEYVEDSPFYEKWCSRCAHRSVCKYCGEACASSSWSTGCKRFLDIKEVKTEVVPD